MVDINQVYRNMIRDVMHGGRLVPSRNGTTMEKIAALYDVDDIQKRMICSHMINVPFALAEVLWILTHRSDVEMVGFYNKQIKDYSDDGLTFNAAYGKRMGYAFGIDQMRDVFEKLNASHESRHALIIYSQPINDNFQQKTLDRACNISSLFLIREGQLHLTQTIRSNDAVWGVPYNFFVFTMIQDILARLLGVEPGPIHWLSNSLHIYERHWDEADRLPLEVFNIYDYFHPYDIGLKGLVNEGYAAFKNFLSFMRDAEEEIRNFGDSQEEQILNIDVRYGVFWQDMLYTFMSYHHWKHNDTDVAMEHAEKIQGSIYPYLMKNYYQWRIKNMDEVARITYVRNIRKTLNDRMVTQVPAIMNWITREV